MRLEQYTEEVKNFSQAQDKWQTHDSQAESNVKVYKQKAKKYENYLKKSVQALKTIGLQLNLLQATSANSHGISGNEDHGEAMLVSELGRMMDEKKS